jgi:hypothetical protein
MIVFEYFFTLKRNEAIYEIISPAIFSILITFISLSDERQELINSINTLSGSLLTIIGILTGLSIAVMTVVAGSDKGGIEKMKTKESERILHDRKISIYRHFLIVLSYSVIVGGIVILFNIFIPHILRYAKYIWVLKSVFCLNIFAISHIVLINIRSSTNFYMILFSDSKK